MKFRDDMKVTLRQRMGSEKSIVAAARLSTNSDEWEGVLTGKDKGLIRALYREGHGSPFEHVVFTFEIECPIFVSRQLVKYRNSSTNEISARYTELPLEFYRPDRYARGFFQEGKTMDYQFRDAETQAEDTAIQDFIDNLEHQNQQFAELFTVERKDGIAKELARITTPVNLYTRLVMTMNLRTVLHLIAQRIDNPNADRPSHGQFEIGLVAEQMRQVVEELFPTVWEVFEEQKWKKL